MKKSLYLLGLVALFSTLPLFAGEKNLVVNPAFTVNSADNVPKPWRGEFFKIKENTVGLAPVSGKLSHIWQPIEKARPGTRYELRYEAKIEQGAEARVCCYWPAKVDGKTVSQCNDNWRWVSGDGTWKAYKALVNYPKEATRMPYLSFNVRKGSAAFRNVVLVELVPEAPLHELGGVWKLSDSAKIVSVGAKRHPAVRFHGRHVPGAVLADIPVKGATQYRIDFSVQGIGESGTGTGFHSYRVEVRVPELNYTFRKPWDDVWTQSPQKKFIIAKNLPAGADTIQLDFYAGGKSNVMVKDLTITPYRPDPAEECGIVLDAPSYRDTIYASSPVEAISGRITASGQVRSIDLTLKNAENEILGKTTVVPGGKFSFSAGKLGLGTCQLSAAFRTADNKVFVTRTKSIGKLAAKQGEVVQRGAERHFYRDGKVFLPVIFMVIPGNERQRRFAAANGVTGHIAYVGNESSALRALDMARTEGLDVVLGIRYCEDGRRENWRKRVAGMLTGRVLAHPALLGYFLADEPLWVGANLADYTYSYRVLRELDPHHPVWMNSAPLSSIEDNRPYCEAADVNGVDVYPVPWPNAHSMLADKNPSAVGAYTRTMLETTDSRKAVWMVLQGTSWATMADRKAEDMKKYPSLDESRFMAYDALVNGANGLAYYGVEMAKDPVFLNNLLTVTRELHAMAPLLMRFRRSNESKASDPNILCIDFREGDKLFTLAMNRGTKSVRANVGGLFASGRCGVLHEKRELPVKNGMVEDAFAPFSVHVYSQSKLPEPLRKLPVWNEKSNPFEELCRNTNTSGTPYTGPGAWIWEKSLAKTQGSVVRLRRDFDLSAVPERARLRIAADDGCSIIVNGRKVGSQHSWSSVGTFDLKPFLKQGRNRLEIRAYDSGHLPCGVLFDFFAELPAKKTVTFASGADTLASSDADNGTWSPALVIAPAGSGAWGNRVRIPSSAK